MNFVNLLFPQLPAPFALLVGAVGLYQFVRGAWMMWEGDGSLSWPTVKGVVQYCTVEHHAGARTTVGGMQIAEMERGYEVIVEYAYEIDGATHVSRRWSFSGGLLFDDELDAMARAQRYREGTPITVHYDPTAPATSVIKTGDYNKGLWRAVGGGVLICYALYAYLSS